MESPRDSQRAAVYAVEDQWGQVLDRGGDLDFFGSRLHLPRQQTFSDLAGIQRYVDALLTKSWERTCEPELSESVQVRQRRGGTRAHYERSPTPAIAIPLHAQWACREVVILHELAHHLSSVGASGTLLHDARFRSHLVHLTDHALGPEAAFVLRAGYQGAGLSVSDVDCEREVVR
ncbi:MAG: TIGR04338 family metallohydrolase [Actinomycetales bacterium]